MEERRTYFWHHAEDGEPLWRHGRAHVVFPERGRRTPHSPNRQDLQLNAEWSLLTKRYAFGFGGRFKWGTNGSETTPDIALHLSRLGNVYLSAGGLIPYRWLERHTADGKVDYESREFAIAIDKRGFRWSIWARVHAWSRSDPWWMNPSWEWERLFLGRWDASTVEGDTGETLVPLPEGTYAARWTEKITTWTYKGRRLGRLRDAMFGPRTRRYFDLSIEGGIPIEGKGENSWDCGMDGLFGCGGDTIEAAVGNAVGHVLRGRKRHGGPHDLTRPMTVTEAGSR